MIHGSELFDELHEGIRERADRIDIRDGLVGDVVRVARRRAAGRATVVAVPALAAVGAAVVLALGSVPGGRHAVVSSARAPGSSVPTLPARDTIYTADIVRRVRAELTHLAVAGAGQVLEQRTTLGNGTAAYPTSENTDFMYIDPRSGVAYQRSVDRSARGVYLQTNGLVTTPVHGALHTAITSLDPRSDTYFTSVSAVGPAGPVSSAISGTELGIRSTEQQIARALASGRVRREGTATVDGQSTIKLSAPASGESVTLYVNARTDQPVREVDVFPNNPGHPSAGNATTTLDWLATTAADIALTKLRIPAGYTRASSLSDGYWRSSAPLTFMGY